MNLLWLIGLCDVLLFTGMTVLLAPLKPAQREVFMELLATLVEANNQYSRTVLRSM